MPEYPVVLVPDNDQIQVNFPDLPEAHTFGDDEEDALEWAVGALVAALAARMADERPVPSPSPPNGRPTVALPPAVGPKIALYQAMYGQGVTRAELARRLGWDAWTVDELLDVAKPADPTRVAAALKALGQRPHADVSGRTAAGGRGDGN